MEIKGKPSVQIAALYSWYSLHKKKSIELKSGCVEATLFYLLPIIPRADIVAHIVTFREWSWQILKNFN